MTYLYIYIRMRIRINTIIYIYIYVYIYIIYIYGVMQESYHQQEDLPSGRRGILTGA